jgi:hypothetical protein
VVNNAVVERFGGLAWQSLRDIGALVISSLPARASGLDKEKYKYLRCYWCLEIEWDNGRVS